MSKRSLRLPSDDARGGRGWLLALVLGVALGLGAGWYFSNRMAPSPVAASNALSASERAALGEFVERYFGTWSAKDIDGYGRCFHPNAQIWFGTNAPMPLAPFLESQRRAHADSPVPLTEIPLEWDGDVRNGLAHVRVRWELHRGAERERGYDFFTLVFSERRWQIIALVFNQE